MSFDFFEASLFFEHPQSKKKPEVGRRREVGSD